ncbi:hypothetical protein LUZ60_006984 [Juncus effusus]|nr:hypothetical protein LUZ60_006984 [Juncus effusus]
MASSKLRKAKNDSFIETDMLSNLPENVKEKILTYLPIKEAGRTSILFTKWRYTWASIPELVLSCTETPSNLVAFVDAIFVLHRGPIRKFDLHSRRGYPEAFGRWIVNMSRNGIREFVLYLCHDRYVLHSAFFSCDELNCVNLGYCSFKLPSRFKGFELLHTLKLKKVAVSDDDLEKLISSCPLLTKLKLVALSGCVVLNIHAPNLLSLKLFTEFLNLQIYAPKLLSLSVEMIFTHESVQLRESLFGNLPNLETIVMRKHFFKKFPLIFNRLKNLAINLDFGEEKEAAFVLALFQGATHLQSLTIGAFLCDQDTLPISNFWEKAEGREGLFKQLQTVDIVDWRVENSAVDSLLSFVKFILNSASQLETMMITESQENKADERMMLKQLLQLERASPKAKIIFE